MALQQIANTDISSTGTFALGSVSSSALTSGRVTYATTGGLLTDSSSLTYDGTTLTSTKFAGALNGTVGATSPSTVLATSVTNSGLTSGRITFATTSGLLTDSSTLTYDGTTLTTPRLALGGTTLPSAGTATLFLRSSDNSTYLQTGSGNNIYFLDGSQNTMLSLTPSSLAFQISNAAKLTLNSTTLHTANGISVGIGTATPARVLELKAAQACMVFNDNTNVWTVGTGSFIDGSNSFNFYLGGVGTYLRINSSGNLGLGLGLVPSAWLASSKAIQVGDYASFWWDGYTGSTAIGNNVYQSGNTTDNYIVSGVASTRYRLAGGAHAWFIAPSGTAGNAISFTQAMTLNASGNLGIGTTSPAAFTGFTTNRTVLQIANTTSDSGQIILGGATNALLLDYNNAAGDVTIRNTYGASAAGALINIDSGTLVFRTGTSYTERMRIDSTGNLILNSATPAYLASTSNLAQISINRSPSTGAIFNASQSAAFMNIDGASGGSSIQFATAAANNTQPTERMRLNSGGDALFGTPDNTTNGGIILAPGYNGEGISNIIVGHKSTGGNGNQYMIFNYNGTGIGSIAQSGTTAVLYNTTSDQRLKTNIVDAPSGNIDDIKVRSFDWIADGNHQTYGLVAQELLEVAPYAVHQPQKPEEMMAVDYSKLVPMMIKSIQEQQALIESMATKLKDAGVAGF